MKPKIRAYSIEHSELNQLCMFYYRCEKLNYRERKARRKLIEEHFDKLIKSLN